MLRKPHVLVATGADVVAVLTMEACGSNGKEHPRPFRCYRVSGVQAEGLFARHAYLGVPFLYNPELRQIRNEDLDPARFFNQSDPKV